ncbi:hypothetical protein A9Q97_02515, partial [Rhodospirillales bacterium 47_12_T64]
MLMSSPWKHPKHGNYYIRISIPERLRAAFGGKREYKYPLVNPVTGNKIREPAQAKKVWADYYSAWEQAKAQAEANLTGTSYELTDKQIAALRADWMARELAKWDMLPDELDLDLRG